MYAGESGEECSIDIVLVSNQEVETYFGDENVLVSPDKNPAVKVGAFQGTPTSDCLDAARTALGW